jgi:hypothetical protein
MKNGGRIEGFISLPFLCLGGLVLLLVGTSFSAMLNKRAKQFQPPEVENKTKSFRLVSVEKAENDLVLRFKNTSVLTITGYTFALGQERIGADFFPNAAQKGIEAGAIEEVRIPLFNISSQPGNKIVVLTVVFQDHSSEGDFQAARLILDRRKGFATQMQRIRSLLLRAANNTDQGSSVTPMTVLKQLRETISSLPDQNENNPSLGMKSGLNFAKQWTLKQIARLEAGEMDVELDRRSRGFTEQAAGSPKPLRKVRMGLEYIVDKVDEITKKL